MIDLWRRVAYWLVVPDASWPRLSFLGSADSTCTQFLPFRTGGQIMWDNVSTNPLCYIKLKETNVTRFATRTICFEEVEPLNGQGSMSYHCGPGQHYHNVPSVVWRQSKFSHWRRQWLPWRWARWNRMRALSPAARPRSKWAEETNSHFTLCGKELCRPYLKATIWHDTK